MHADKLCIKYQIRTSGCTCLCITVPATEAAPFIQGLVPICLMGCDELSGINYELSIIRIIIHVVWLTERRDHFKIAIATTQLGSFLVVYHSQLDLSQKMWYYIRCTTNIPLGIKYILALSRHNAVVNHFMTFKPTKSPWKVFGHFWLYLDIKYQIKCPLQTIDSRPWTSVHHGSSHLKLFSCFFSCYAVHKEAHTCLSAAHMFKYFLRSQYKVVGWFPTES